MFVADTALLSRLENIVIWETERFVACARELYPETAARSVRVGEGIALFGAEEIPFSEVVGLGVTRAATDAELDLVEAFYDDYSATPELLACSSGDPGLIPMLARRGWQPSGFEDVLVLPLEAASVVEPGPEFDIRIVAPDELERWAECVALGFSESGEPGEREVRFSRIVASREDALLVWAWVGDRPVATGELVVCDGVGWLSADTTQPDYRGQGIQQALQRFRVARAAEAGCDIAVSEATPGGPSHRNMERLGFRVAYTHLLMEKRAGA